MKYLVIDEMSKEELAKVVTSPNVALHAEEREKGNIPPHVLGDHMIHGDLPQLTQNYRAFKIYETDSPEQLSNIDALWSVFNIKTWKRWVIPITETGLFTAAFDKYKKKVK
jgi:hypothetical protein